MEYYKIHRTTIKRSLYASLIASFGVRLYLNLKPKGLSQKRSIVETKSSGNAQKVSIDSLFLKKLSRLLRIAFPKLCNRGSFLVIVQAVLLVFRTYLSLQVAKLDGRITAALVRARGKLFLKTIVVWMLLGLPASATNACIQYNQRMLALHIRTQLTQHAVSRYLTSSSSASDAAQPVYYQLHQSGTNTGQLIAADSSKFALSLSRLYSNLTKPLLDVVVYTYQLGRSVGGDNVFLLGLTIQLSARILRLAAPPFGEFVATEAEMEGDFRAAQSRIVEHAEEIALYNGNLPEKTSLDRIFYSLTHHIKFSLKHRLTYQALEDFVIKYLWGAAGLVSCALPIFSHNQSSAHRAEEFVVNRRLLLLSSDAVGRVMGSYKEISALAGITTRVSDFMDMVEPTQSINTEPYVSKLQNTIIADYIEFQNLSVVSPSGEVLIRDLQMRINEGDHLLIVGPNGSGKSSLFRVLGGLWPITHGCLLRPDHHDVFYIPQRPYLNKGTLRQQIIYPKSEQENTASDEDLMKILEVSNLGSLLESVGGFDTVREWRDDLSMGAQQKIAAARLFYHRPKFAILDECTASVTLDTETKIYTHAQKLGITLLTVSHRASLWKYHNKILQLDGQGGYLFTDLDPPRRLALEEEKLKIDYQLRQVDAAVERLAVLKQEKKRWSSN